MKSLYTAPSPRSKFFAQPAHTTLHCTDTIGGPLNITDKPDPEAQITILLRSSATAGTHLFDTYGRTGAHAHVVAETVRLLTKEAHAASGKTLLLCNGAPRTEEDGERQVNGEQFYTTGIPEAGLQIIAPLHAFRHIREQIRNLFAIDGEGSLWPEGCQFRSSFVANAQEKNLIQANNEIIPHPQHAELSYVDRFGNCRCRSDDPEVWNTELLEAAVHPGKGPRKGSSFIKLRIGDVCREVILALEGRCDLSSIKRQERDLVLYRDHTRGNIHTIVWPWQKESTPQQQFTNSPYSRFGQNCAIEGSPIFIS